MSVYDLPPGLAGAGLGPPGPQDTQDAAQALLVLARIQTRLQGPQGAGPQG